MFRFYALHTLPGREHKIARDLEHRLQNVGLAASVRQVVVPQRVEVDVAPDGSRRERTVNPVPGYLLIEANLSDQLWGLIMMTPGVHPVGTPGAPPMALSAREVDRMLQRTPAGEPVQRAQASFQPGDVVEIVGGPFSGIEAYVVEADEDRLAVEISLFERVVPAQIDIGDVRLVHRARP